MNLSQIIIRPVLTEKSVRNSTANKYTFVVNNKATKVDVKSALKALYGVSATKVNMLETRPKYRFGRNRALIQKRGEEKRAIVTLRQGETLDLNKPAKKS